MSFKFALTIFLSFLFLSPWDIEAQQNISPTKLSQHLFLQNGCGITVNAGPDITICVGQGKNLSGNVNGSNQYEWEPIDGLSNPNILNPVANPSMTTTYTLTAHGISNNLIMNGNFETGNIAPATSQYTQYTNVNNLITSTGGYMIMSVPQIASAFGCNPNIGAFTMVITPTGSGTNIWCQTINVTPNTDYKIEYKVFGIPYIFGSPPTIGLKVNGTLIGSVDAPSGLCLEAIGSFMWNSGAANTGTFCFENFGGTGPASMCAIDDITIKECCVEKDEVTVEVYDLIAEAAPVDEINCLNRPITIDASGSSQGNGISYNWTTKNGRIVRNEKTLMPVVDTPGIYTLKITGLYGCEKELIITVNGSVTKPDIKIKSTDIDCKNATGSIEASSKSSSPQFEWNGPNGFYSPRATNNNIKEPGEYTVKVTDSYGCESTSKVEIKDNRSLIEAEITGDSITCAKDSAVLISSSIGKKPNYFWNGPKGFKKDSSIKMVTKDTGWYYLTTIDSFGCSELDSFYVKDLQNNIALKIFGDTLTCSKKSLAIKLITDTTATINWKGPNGFISNILEPIVTESGWYFVDVKTKDGCIGSDSIFIEKSADLPDLFISNEDTITCDKKMITITGGTNTPGAQFEWQTPTGIVKNQNQIQAVDSGIYLLQVTGVNGCILTKSITISKDIDKPSITGMNDTLNCIKDSVHLNITAGIVRSYIWTGPNNFNSNVASPIIRLKGNYNLVVTGVNGCTSDIQLQIDEDKAVPFLQLSADTINCKQSQIVPFILVDSNTVGFNWIGPNNFNSIFKAPPITKGGIYTVTVQGINGCLNSQILEIIEDTNLPNASLEADTIQCKSTASIRALNISPGANIQWQGPNNFNSNLPNPTITQSGFYILQLTGLNGCIFMDSVFVFQKDQLPDVFAKDDTLSCIQQKLFLFGGSATQGVRFEWTGPNGFISTLARPEIQDSGIYILKVIDANGCESTKQIHISKFSEQAILSLIKSNDKITCKDSVIQLSINANLPAQSIRWLGPNGYNSNAQQITINEPGKYLVIFSTGFGCISLDSITIQDLRKLPIFNVLDDSINCIRTNVTLQLNTGETDLVFNWSGPGNFSSTLQNPRIINGGNYTITVTNSAACTLIKTLNIKSDTSKPDLFLSADTITCTRNIAPIKASSSLQGFTMKWTGPNGFNYTLPQFSTKVPGRYFCTITNPRSGCSTSTFVDVIEDTSRIRDLMVQGINSSCNKNDGKIEILNILGGNAPYKYSIDNGITFLPNLNNLNLAAGIYSVIVEDSNGCRFTSSVNILENESVKINLAPQIELNSGSNTTIKLNILSNPNDISTILWSPADQLSCNDCMEPLITADHDDLITVIVTDINGCTSSATIQLIVKKESKVYFPNVFSPNGDNINDFFYPIGLSPNAKINYLNIYDRWGNLVFQKINGVPGIEKDGWGGLSSNQDKVNPGVYIYLTEISDQGEIKTYSGDITLLQ
ncbi:MAG: gliding motility-associated C-terminal domain-containing protein [Saprospiraceae bacterium]